MTTPDSKIEELLFSKTFDSAKLAAFASTPYFIQTNDFKNINWLNTPGPIYTTITDNIGTGQVAAIHNVGGDEDYREIIFKQPFTLQELNDILAAASFDPLDSYYFGGNLKWNKKNIAEWWKKSNERVSYIIERYKEELHLPDPLYRPLYGPRQAMPENYKYWLDFYQFSMKEYLEWYIYKLHALTVNLPAFSFDWTRRLELDKLYFSKP